MKVWITLTKLSVWKAQRMLEDDNTVWRKTISTHKKYSNIIEINTRAKLVDIINTIGENKIVQIKKKG